jgi:hypothetical protein
MDELWLISRNWKSSYSHQLTTLAPWNVFRTKLNEKTVYWFSPESLYEGPSIAQVTRSIALYSGTGIIHQRLPMKDQQLEE